MSHGCFHELVPEGPDFCLQGARLFRLEERVAKNSENRVRMQSQRLAREGLKVNAFNWNEVLGRHVAWGSGTEGSSRDRLRSAKLIYW